MRFFMTLLLLIFSVLIVEGRVAVVDDNKAPPRLDQFGDSIPAGALMRLGTVRFRPAFGLGGLAYTPDGKTLISGREFWDTATGRRVSVLAAEDGTWRTMALSPDGQVVALGVQGGAAIFDVRTGHELRRLKAGTVRSLAFSGDGKTLVTGGVEQDPAIRVWDLATGNELRRMVWHRRNVDFVACTPDGKTLISASHVLRQIHWANLENGEEIRSVASKDPEMEALAMSPDGELLDVGGMRFRQNAKPGTRNIDASLKLLSVSTGKTVREFEGHEHDVKHVAFSRDGKMLASSSFDKTIRLWDVATGKELQKIEDAEGVGELAYGRVLAFAPDCRTLAVGGGAIRFWDIPAGKPVLQFDAPERAASALQFSGDGKTLAMGSMDKAIRLWDVASGQTVRQLKGHEQPVHRLLLLPDGKTLVSGSHDSSIHFWDMCTGEQIRRIALHDPTKGEKRLQVLRMGHSRDGTKLLAFCYPLEELQDAWIMTWEAATGRQINKVLDHRGFNGNMPEFSPDGEKLAYRMGSPIGPIVVLYDLATEKELLKLEVPPYFSGFVFAPDGKSLAVQCSERAKGESDPRAQVKSIRVYNLTTREMERRIAPPDGGGPWGSMQFTSDSRKLAFTTPGRVHIWDVAADKECWSSPKLDCAVFPICLSPDGRRLAAGLSDTTVLIWDISETLKK